MTERQKRAQQERWRRDCRALRRALREAASRDSRIERLSCQQQREIRRALLLATAAE